MNPVNDQPAFSGLDNTPSFTEGGASVVLDNNATIADPELDAANDYSGATLALVRNGGANAEDLFDGSGTLNPLVESGSLVVGGTTIGTVTTNSGGTLVLTFNSNATTALVNSALQQLTYANSSGNPPASVQVDFTIDDGNTGGQGSGGPLNAMGSITITITAANTAPAVDLDADDSSGATGNDYQFTFTEGDGPTAIADNDTNLVDVDGNSFASVKLTVSGLLDGNAEVLMLDGDTFALATAVAGQDTSGGNYHVVITTGAGTATVTITKQGGGLFSEGETETLITAVQYQHTDANAPTDGDRLIDVIVNDGTDDSAAGRTTINVNPVNDAPTVDLDVDNSSGTPGNDYQVTFTEGDGPTVIADTDTDLVDVDSTTFASVNLSVSGLLDGNAEVLVLDGDTFALATAVAGQDTSGGNYHVVITTGAGTATVTITKQGGGTFTEIETETLIKAIQYQHTDTSNPTDGDRLIDVIVNDGTDDSPAARTTINVNPVNDQPTATIVPISYGLNEDDLFKPIGGVSVSDLDAGTNDLSVTLSVNDGILRLVTTTGLTFASGANDSATMTVTGTTTNINNALATLEYQPDPDFAGSDLLTLSVDDLGNTGGGSLTHVDTANIIVAAINDPPTFSGLDNTPTFTEGGAAVVLDNNATIADPELDAANDYSGATLTLVRNGGANAEDLFDGRGTLNPLIESGSLVVSGTTIGTVTTNSGGTLVLTFNSNATTALVNNALQKITYANSSGTPPASVQIDFTIDDSNVGAQGSGGALNDTGSITVTITTANNPPVAVADGFTVNEGSTNTLNLAGNDTDADNGLDLASITIISGPANGTIDSINVNGTVDYTHNGSETLADSFTYTIDDLAGATSNTVTVSLTVTPQNDAPIITSNGGGASATITVIEGNTAVTDVNANDAEGGPLTFSLIGGADAAKFSIDPTTGVLTFKTAPDFEAPGDVGSDNVYDVVVQVSDGTTADTQTIAVTVTKAPPVFIPPPPPDPTPDPTPPPTDGDGDDGESEDETTEGGVPVVASSPGNLPGGSHGSTAKDSRDSDTGNNFGANNLSAMEQRTENTSLGNALDEILDLLRKPFESTAIKGEIQAILTRWGFLEDLDRVRDAFQDVTATEQTYLASSVAASTGLSIGYVFWLLRSGVLLTALLSSLPAWQFVNPLLVLDRPEKKKRKKGQEDPEDDSVESMFENHSVSAETSETKIAAT